MMRNWLIDEGIMSGLIDAGGDIAVWGRGIENRCEIMIADPFYPEYDIAILKIKREAGIATSSTFKRAWLSQQHRVFHHIIDPVTKQPSQSDLVQVTVVASDLTEAEVYAKCLLILGSEEGIGWLEERRPDLGFVAVRQDRSVVTTSSLDQYCGEWSVQN
jgi:thiamine biosynthesis lipoprotein